MIYGTKIMATISPITRTVNNNVTNVVLSRIDKLHLPSILPIILITLSNLRRIQKLPSLPFFPAILMILCTNSISGNENIIIMDAIIINIKARINQLTMNDICLSLINLKGKIVNETLIMKLTLTLRKIFLIEDRIVIPQRNNNIAHLLKFIGNIILIKIILVRRINIYHLTNEGINITSSPMIHTNLFNVLRIRELA